MKVVILAASKSESDKDDEVNYGFPVGSKPKCLFHYRKEVLLERQVKVLRAVGLNDITVVVGYQKELIKLFNSQNGLGLKLVYNPTGETDVKPLRWVKGFDSIKVGVQGVDDDVLFIPGDVYLHEEGLRKVLAEESSVIGVGGHGWQIFKVRRNVLPHIREFEGTGFLYPLVDLIKADGGITIATGLVDVDYYRQTDEGLMYGYRRDLSRW